MPMTAIKGFIAGALSVLTFMTAAWWLCRAGGLIPATAPPFWSMTPAIPPLGVPRYLNLIFWGGVWGLVLSLLFQRLSGAGYWLAWLLAGVIAVAGTAMFIVPTIKGEALNLAPIRFVIFALLHGVFGLGAGIWLAILGRGDRALLDD